MKVLIAGGSGLVGMRLSEMLIDAGHEVAHLTRDPARQPTARYRAYRWDLRQHQLDEAALQWADAIVNLAGASVAAEKWTPERKREIHDSRVDGAHLLRDGLRHASHHVRTYLSASATGIYGDTGDRLVDETSPPDPADFLSRVCIDWEEAATNIRALGLRVAILRLGIVLSDEGGALPQIARPVKLGAGAPLGSGQQVMPWIHLDDACRAFLKALDDARFTNVYNVVAPNPVTNADFTRELATVLNRPLLLPRVPAFGLKLVLGEMSDAVLHSNRVSCERLLNLGFQFEFPRLGPALESFYD